LTLFEDKICLFEIKEIIIINNIQTIIECIKIKLNGFNSYCEAYEVDQNEHIILNLVFLQLNHFNGRPINLINTPMEDKLFRIK
jgi:hypothetical protein